MNEATSAYKLNSLFPMLQDFQYSKSNRYNVVGAVCLNQWFPTTAPGTTSAPQAVLKCSKKKFEIHNTSSLKPKFDSRYEWFITIFLSSAPQPLKGWETLL